MTVKKFNPEKAELLMRTDRKKLLPPDKIVGLLNISFEDTIVDLGAGNGLFYDTHGKTNKGNSVCC
jgi:tRNA A58 N-methylase Trm61